MNNLLVLGDLYCVSYAFILQIMEPFAIANGLTLVKKYYKDCSTTDISKSDVCLFVNSMSVLSAEIARIAHATKRFTVSWYGDDKFTIGGGHATGRTAIKAIYKTLHCTDVVLQGTEYIAKLYAKYTPSQRYALVDSIVPHETVCSPVRHDTGAFRIVYAGIPDPEHERWFNGIILPAIEEVISKASDTLEVTVFDRYGKLEELSGKCENLIVNRQARLPLQEYLEFLGGGGGFHIGIAPIEISAFSRSKYYVKWIDYTRSGIAGIYTNSEPYTLVVNDGVNGVLTDNTVKTWAKAIVRYVNDEQYRINIIKNAQRDLAKSFLPDKVFGRIIQQVPEFIDYISDKSIKINSFRLIKLIDQYIIRNKLRQWMRSAIISTKRGGLKQLAYAIRQKIIRAKKDATL
jgi:hypothetical protein